MGQGVSVKTEVDMPLEEVARQLSHQFSDPDQAMKLGMAFAKKSDDNDMLSLRDGLRALAHLKTPLKIPDEQVEAIAAKLDMRADEKVEIGNFTTMMKQKLKKLAAPAHPPPPPPPACAPPGLTDANTNQDKALELREDGMLPFHRPISINTNGKGEPADGYQHLQTADPEPWLPDSIRDLPQDKRDMIKTLADYWGCDEVTASHYVFQPPPMMLNNNMPGGYGWNPYPMLPGGYGQMPPGPGFGDYAAGLGPAGDQNAMGQKAPKSAAKPSKAEKKKTEKPEEAWTTLMVKNLPPDLTHEQLKELLYGEPYSCRGLIDYMYLPIDFSRTNAPTGRGYAFVNFREKAEADRIKHQLEGFGEWKKVCESKSGKHIQVGWANNQQGLQENVDRFRESSVNHPNLEACKKPQLYNEEGNSMGFPDPPKDKNIKLPRVQQSSKAKAQGSRSDIPEAALRASATAAYE